MAGHVFILRADLTRLLCDAWLMPCDYEIDIMPHWTSNIPSPGIEWKPPQPTREWRDRKTRVMEATGWPERQPLPWLVDTGGTWDREPGWYVQGVEEFFNKAAPAAKEKQQYAGKRAKPLLALPLVGTGAGGAWERVGLILRHLLPTLYQAAEDHDVDIALVVRSPQAYAAAINERRGLGASRQVWPEELAKDLQEKARKLSERAKKGELVLFLGAGVSAGAGLPTWDRLLEELALRAGVFSSDGSSVKRLKDDFNSLTHLDRARLISDFFHAKEACTGSHIPIGRVVSDLLGNHRHYCIAHSALAALPVKEIVTTNYDLLFEAASTYPPTNEPPPVLPYDPPQPGERWVLKLHGCLTKPEDIVLTRSDYLRYDDTRAALKGIVQALLITRHMLFVGFSLTDDNFHRIVEDVRKVVRNNRNKEVCEKQFGTALSTSRNQFIEKLWKNDLDWISFQSQESLSSYRLQEVFLDYLASESVSATSYLMNERYDGMLTESERSLREKLTELIRCADDQMKALPAWKEIRNLIRSLGGKLD